MGLAVHRVGTNFSIYFYMYYMAIQPQEPRPQKAPRRRATEGRPPSRRPPPFVDEAILRLRPCRRPLWQLQVCWLVAWRLGNILIGLDIAGLLSFWRLVFVLLVLAIAVCEILCQL